MNKKEEIDIVPRNGSFAREVKKKKEAIEKESENGSYAREVKVKPSHTAYKQNILVAVPKEVHITVYDIQHFVTEIWKLQNPTESYESETDQKDIIFFKKGNHLFLTYESDKLVLVKCLTLSESNYLSKLIISKFFNILLVEIELKDRDENLITSKFLSSLNRTFVEIKKCYDSMKLIKYIKNIQDVLIKGPDFNFIHDLPRTYLFNNLATLNLNYIKFKSKYIEYSLFKVLKYLTKLSNFYILINNAFEAETVATWTYSGTIPSMEDKINHGVSKADILKGEVFGIFSNQVQCNIRITRFFVEKRSVEMYVFKLLRRVKIKVKPMPSKFFRREDIIDYLS